MRTALLIVALLASACLAASQTNGSQTVKNTTCPMFDGYGQVFIGTGVTQVSPDGSARLTCKASKVPTPGDVLWNYANTGSACQVVGKLTNDWEESVTARGSATLTCRLR